MNNATINDRRITPNELVEIIHCSDVAVTTQGNKLRFWTLKLDKIGKKINRNNVREEEKNFHFHSKLLRGHFFVYSLLLYHLDNHTIDNTYKNHQHIQLGLIM